VKISKQDIINTALSVIEIESSSVRKLSDRVDDKFVTACEILTNSTSSVVITGVGKSAHIGRKIAATMTSTGTPAIFMHAAEALHGDLGIASVGSAIIAISYSGETEEVLKLMPTFKRFNIPVISMTGKDSSSLAEQSDIHLNVNVSKEACPNGLAPTASTTATLAMGDAIAMCLLEIKGFGERDFATFHPGGSLGKKLHTNVEDIMRTGDSLPIVEDTISVKDALDEMSAKKLGMTAVVNSMKDKKVTGIFTDGDLRRLLCKSTEIEKDKISKYMSKEFKYVNAKTSISSAIHMMEKYKVYCFPVVDDKGSIVGAFSMHDLISARLV
jgi:arabinose-5-phosphate isomerase